MVEKRRLLGEYLIEQGIISPDQLKTAIEEGKRSNRKIGDVLIKLGYAKEDDIVKALSEQLGIPFIDVDTYQFDPASVALIPFDAAFKLRVIGVYQIANSLTVAMTDPLNVTVIDELEKLTGLTINPVFATPTGIKKAIQKYYSRAGSSATGLGVSGGSGTAATSDSAETLDISGASGTSGVSGVADATGEAGAAKTGGISAGRSDDLPKLREQAAQAPVIKLVNKIIEDAVTLKASDAHLEPQDKRFLCRYRVDGILQDFIELKKDLELATISRIKIMANINIAEKRLPQDGRIQTQVKGKEIDLRVATFPTIHGEHVAIRVLDKSTGILSLDELGLKGDLLRQFQSLITKPHGLFLVTGPTGSGKSTTLYSVLNTVNDKKKNIITLEDPVEYTIEYIHQSQVNVKAGLTFAVGLRSIVRLDPDIIMIGEIRDRETAEIAIHAALTGHLVFSTLHTNDAPSACARLINIGLESYLLASSLTGVVAQRLVRKLCDQCKKPHKPEPREIESLGMNPSDFQNAQIFRENGCKACRQTGYSGRIGIFEILVPNEKIRTLITQKASSKDLMKEARTLNMTTLLEDGIEKIRLGITSISEILRITEES